MSGKPLLSLILLTATAAMGSSPGFQLGVAYSEWLNVPSNGGTQIATDNAGSLYILANTIVSNTALATVTKLSSDGKTVLWQNQPGFSATAMAVDPNGGVYVIPARQQADTSTYVAKLAAEGTGLAWKTPVGFLAQSTPALAADSQGRVYFAAQYAVNNFITTSAEVVRLNAAGTAIDYTHLVMGTPISIALEQSGAAFVAGTAVSTLGAGTGFLARVAPDGTAGFYTVFPAGFSQTVAVDGNGNVVLFGGNTVQRVDSTGTVTAKTTLGAPAVSFALDAAGNAYVAVVSNQLYPVKNSLATCTPDPSPTQSPYSQLLTVIAPDGSVLQSTYIPGGDNLGSPLIAVVPHSVFVVATAGPAFTPTQAGPFSGTTGSLFLSSLYSNPDSQTYSLACAASSASLTLGAISPGELVTLMGNGLGPQTGTQPLGTLLTPYPIRAANVQVTFDGTPAPLLWVQDSQINAVTPQVLTPGQYTRVCVSYNNANTNCLTLPVVQSAPAVFMADRRYAAALNQNGTLNSASNPAVPGSIVTVFATGLGPVTPPQSDGALTGLPLPSNVLAYGVEAHYSVGIPYGVDVGVPFEVQYAGPAPFQVAGVSQINFRIAAFASFGAIYLRLGSTFSPGFTIYVTGQ